MATLNLSQKDINELLTVLNVALSEARERDMTDWEQEHINTYRAYMATIRRLIHLLRQQVGTPDFTDEEEKPLDWNAIVAQAQADLEAVQTDQDAYRFIEQYFPQDLRGRYMVIYRSDRQEMNRTPRQALDNLLALPPLE